VLLDWAVAEPARGEVLLPMVEASWLQAYEIGEQPQLQDSVVGRGSHLAAHNLSVLYDGLAISDKALYWRERSLLHGPTPDGTPSEIWVQQGVHFGRSERLGLTTLDGPLNFERAG